MKKPKSKIQKGKSIILVIVFLLGGVVGSILKADSYSKENSSINQSVKTVKGKVVDKLGDPLIGVSVSIVGTTVGVMTDVDGNYTINLPDNAKEIKFSYLGFKEQIFPIQNQITMNITLYENIQDLDEVVVVAYGSTVKRKITNAVSTVNVQQIEDLAGYSDVTTALQGRAPGVIITNSDGSLNATSSISIRGGGDPLYVIDGIVMDKTAFSLLNPQDIESISVMKDAASAAVYGAKAGNGIIVIKTKGGSIGRTKINYTFDQQFNVPSAVRDRLSSYEKATAANQIATMWGSNTMPHTQEAIDAYLTGSDPVNYPNVDWWNSFIRKSASSQRHSLTVDGGNEQTQYRMSLGYYHQGTIFKPINGEELNDRNRINLGLHVNHLFDEIGLKVGMDLKFMRDRKHGKDERNMMGAIAFQEPWSKIYTADGRWYGNTTALFLDPEAGYDDEGNNLFNSRLDLEWDIPKIKGLKATFTGNYGFSLWSVKQWRDVFIPSFFEDGIPVEKNTSPQLYLNKSEGENYEFNVGLKYDRIFAEDHTINTGLYYNQRESTGNSINGRRTGYLVNLDQIFAGPASTATNGGGANESGRLGYIGTLNYDYKSRYLLGASFRYDGSDGFTPDKRWGFFPSVSAGYVVSDEPFMKKINEVIKMDMFKFRVSYGETGVEAGRFNYFTSWTLGDGGFDVNGVRVGTVNTPGLPSTVLTWYTNKSFNYGLDFAFLGNKLSGTADYFVTEIEGYDINPQDKYTTPLGTGLPKIMSDDLFRRAGAEFTLRWKDSNAGFNYDIGGNISFYDELWVRKNEDITISQHPLKRSVGKTLGDGDRMFVSDGLYQSSDDLINSIRPSWGTVRTGNIKYVDMNGDGRIDSSTDSDDRIYNKMPTKPILQYGIDFSLDYKGFSLIGLIQGSGTKYTVLGQNVRPRGTYYMYYKDQLDYWRPDNKDARFPLPNTDRGEETDNQISTYWSVNCAYVRLKNLQIGYDFKYKLLKNVSWLTSAKLSLVGTNLVTISDVSDWIDPEQSETQNWAYPITKTYSVVLSIGF